MSQKGFLPFVDTGPTEEEKAGSDHPSFEDWLLQDANRMGSSIGMVIHEMDLLILECKTLLNQTQPIQSGKIDVRWWKHRSKQGQAPYPLRWKRIRTNHWTGELLPVKSLTKRALRKGRFYDTADYVTTILAKLQDLMEQREELLGAWGIVKRSLSKRVNNRRRALETEANDLAELRKAIEEDPAVRALIAERK